MSDTVRYRAFISYSHRDRACARALHRRLESYRIPARLIGTAGSAGPIPERLTPIFRDRDELPASADLGTQLCAALQASLFLIVVCSPVAAPPSRLPRGKRASSTALPGRSQRPVVAPRRLQWT